MLPVICKMTCKHNQVDQVGLSERKNGCWLEIRKTWNNYSIIPENNLRNTRDKPDKT